MVIIVKSDLRSNLILGGNRREEEAGSVACSGPASSPVLCPWSSSIPSDKASMTQETLVQDLSGSATSAKAPPQNRCDPFLGVGKARWHR